jgi:hypothetical protein
MPRKEHGEEEILRALRSVEEGGKAVEARRGHGISAGTPDHLNDFQHRLLAPMMARWLSPDPSGLAAVSPANPQS